MRMPRRTKGTVTSWARAAKKYAMDIINNPKEFDFRKGTVNPHDLATKVLNAVKDVPMPLARSSGMVQR